MHNIPDFRYIQKIHEVHCFDKVNSAKIINFTRTFVCECEERSKKRKRKQQLRLIDNKSNTTIDSIQFRTFDRLWLETVGQSPLLTRLHARVVIRRVMMVMEKWIEHQFVCVCGKLNTIRRLMILWPNTKQQSYSIQLID